MYICFSFCSLFHLFTFSLASYVTSKLGILQIIPFPPLILRWLLMVPCFSVIMGSQCHEPVRVRIWEWRSLHESYHS